MSAMAATVDALVTDLDLGRGPNGIALTPSGGATTRTTLRTVMLPKITLHTRSVTG